MSNRTTLGRQAVAIPAPDPIPLGDNRYRVPSAAQPHVSYIVDLDAGEGGTCGCPHFIYRQTPCKHLNMARRAARAAASSESVDSLAQSPATPQTPRGSHFDPETGEYRGPLAEAFDRPMRRR